MKHINNIKLVSSIREISNVLDIISGSIRIFATVLVIMQAILLARDIKQSNKE